MSNIKDEAESFYALACGEKYKAFVNTKVDSRTRKIARAVLDILEIDEISVANAKLVLHLCEDALERCVVANTTTDV